MKQEPDIVVSYQLPIGFPPGSRWSKRAGLHVLHYDTVCGAHVQNPTPRIHSRPTRNMRLEYADRLAHRAFDVQRLDILPVLLQ